MREKNLQTELKPWINKHLSILASGAYELKLTKTDRFRFDALPPHQIEALLKVANEGLYYKIVDSGAGSDGGAAKKPFDFFILRGVAYLVVGFYIPRKKKICYFIPIEKFLDYKTKSKMKSMTESEARDLADRIADLHQKEDLTLTAAQSSL